MSIVQEYSAYRFKQLKHDFLYLLQKKEQQIKAQKNPLEGFDRSSDLDKEILGALTFIQAQLTHWIFQDFQSSFGLIAQIHSDIFRESIVLYSSDASYFTGDYDRISASYRISYDKFVKVCKNLINFYRELIKRLQEVYGLKEDIQKLLLPLGLSNGRHRQVNDDALPMLRKILQQCLCFLGTITRYRAQYNYAVVSDPYKTSRIYYRAAVNIYSRSDVPYTLLCENHHEENEGALFSILYWRCRALVACSECTDEDIVHDIEKFYSFKPEMESMDANEWIALGSVDKERELERYIQHIKQISKGLRFWRGNYEFNEERLNSVLDSLKAQLTDWVAHGVLTERAMIRLSQLQILFLTIFGKFITDENASHHQLPNPSYYIIFNINISTLNIMLEHVGKDYQDKTSNWISCRSSLSSLRIYINWFRFYIADNVELLELSNVQEVIKNLLLLLVKIHSTTGFQFDYAASQPITDLNQLKTLLYEEKQCINFNPIGNNKQNNEIILLSDCASTLQRPLSNEPDIIDQYRLQCILYSGYEMSKQNVFFSFDDVRFQKLK